MEISYKEKVMEDLVDFLDDTQYYNFTINDGRTSTEFSKIGNDYKYSGSIYTEKAVLATYVKKQLIKDLSNLQHKICIYKAENLPEDVWQIYSTIYLILETLDGTEGLPIETLYFKMPNHEREPRYTLEVNWVRAILLQLKVVKLTEDNLLVISDFGKKVLIKYRQGMKVRIRERALKRGQSGKPKLKGRTVCLKCEQPIQNNYGTSRMLCFNCRREEVKIESAR